MFYQQKFMTAIEEQINKELYLTLIKYTRKETPVLTGVKVAKFNMRPQSLSIDIAPSRTFVTTRYVQPRRGVYSDRNCHAGRVGIIDSCGL